MKYFAFLVLVLAAVLSLAACGNLPTSSDGPADAIVQSEQEFADDNNAITNPTDETAFISDGVKEAATNKQRTEQEETNTEMEIGQSEDGPAPPKDEPPTVSSEQDHKHEYISMIVLPTCKADGYTLHTCSRCGNSYKDSYTPATGTPATPVPAPTPTPSRPSTPVHTCNYIVSSTIPGDCTTQGYSVYACTCGDSYKGDYNGGNGHNRSEIYEEVAVFETVCITRCGHCNADITGSVSTHMKEEALSCNGSRSYQTYEQVQVGTETQVVGYVCSVCGAEM